MAQLIQGRFCELEIFVFESLQGLSFSFLHNVQTGSGAHRDTDSYPVVTWLISQGVKPPEREAYHLHLSSTEVKN
jgi:hypothetical protein